MKEEMVRQGEYLLHESNGEKYHLLYCQLYGPDIPSNFQFYFVCLEFANKVGRGSNEFKISLQTAKRLLGHESGNIRKIDKSEVSIT